MGTARRLYVYIVCAVSLLALSVGFVNLLHTVLRGIEDSLGDGSVVVGGGVDREQLSLAIALVLVGLPVYLLHWWLAGRGLRAAGQPGAEERRSGARATYITLVQGATLAAGIASLTSLLGAVLGRLFGAPEPGSWSYPTSVALVAVPLWAWHARLRAGEIRTTRIAGRPAGMTRLYRYGAMLGSLVLGLAGAAGLIGTVLSVLVGRPDFELGAAWWRGVAAGEAAMIGIGFGAWLLHWSEASAAIRDADSIGEDDRRTRGRAVYFGAVLLVATASSAYVVAGALADLGRWISGITIGDTLAFLERVVAPPLTMAPFVLAGWWHVIVRSRETAVLGAESRAASRRAGLHLVALVGLAFVAVGAVQAIALALRQAGSQLEPAFVTSTAVPAELAWYIALLAVGAALWLPAWGTILGARARDLATERASATSRAFLFLVVGVAVVAAVPTATLTLYRLLNTVLGGSSVEPLVVDLAMPIAVVIVALLLGGYHARILIGDLRAAAATRAAEEMAVATGGEVAAPAIAGPAAALARPVAEVQPAGAVPPASLTIELVLHVPAGTDTALLVAGLREHIPSGVTLEQQDGENEVRRPVAV